MTHTHFSAATVLLGRDFDVLALHRVDPARYPVVLESVAHGTAHGRYDIVLAFPGAELRHARPDPAGPAFLDQLDAEFQRCRVRSAGPAAPPFTGGWFLFIGYELRAETEPAAGLRSPPLGPAALALRIPAAIVRDRPTGAAWIVTERGFEACRADIERDLRRVAGTTEALPTAPLAASLTEPPAAEFTTAVATVRRLIAAGDLYQANLARRWTGRLRDDVGAADVYARLRRTNPAPFAGLVAWPGLVLASSSPERLVRVSGGEVETRPIAGTRPVAGSGAATRRRELLASAKERAEHVMLIDLERNDLGRVCVPGTVVVRDYMAIESYAHVHHIVSGVTGTLRPGTLPGAVLRAVFPGGTITGCPKVRCMAVIDALEGAGRGAYSGSMGYLNRDGSADLNILIRSIELSGRDFAFAAGSGIVADSDPEAELEETRAKARGMVLAVTEA